MKSFVLLICFIFLTLINCDENSLENFKKGNRLFSSSIYEEIRDVKNESFLISPLSIHIILALTQFGAKGLTAEEIQKSLHLSNNQTQIANEFKAVTSNMRSDNYNLSSANKVYIQNDFMIMENFKQIAINNFNSDIENIDFAQKNEAAKIMNAWVERQTNNKISNLINPNQLPASTRLVLINALYFRAKWAIPFEIVRTSDRNFYKTPSDVIKIPTMHNDLYLDYYKHEKLAATFLKLPYKGYNAFLTIVLPNEIDGLEKLENNLQNVISSDIEYEQSRLRLFLPKFLIESQIELKEILIKLGINLLFTSNANLTGLTEQNDIYVSDAVQKAFINVTEAGTEAAAATAFFFPTYSGIRPPIIQIKVDHPFLFYITANDILLFIGRFMGN